MDLSFNGLTGEDFHPLQNGVPYLDPFSKEMLITYLLKGPIVRLGPVSLPMKPFDAFV